MPVVPLPGQEEEVRHHSAEEEVEVAHKRPDQVPMAVAAGGCSSRDHRHRTDLAVAVSHTRH